MRINSDAVVRHLDAMGAERDVLRGEVERLRTLLREGEEFWHYAEQGHPGRSCVRTGWQDTEPVAAWRRAVRDALTDQRAEEKP